MSRFEEEQEFEDDDEFLDEEDDYIDEEELERLMEEEEDDDEDDDNGGIFEYWKSRELRLQEQETNIMLLKETIQMLSKSWFWRFKKPEKKLKQVIETYLHLYEIVGE